MPEKSNTKTAGPQEERMCFIIMPISDPDGYVKGHFKHVYQDIIRPACQQAGFSPLRPDEVKQSNLIHLDILQKLLEAPMAICDLSARNPNVLFELGLRQAFDKPVALIQEIGTPQIFDISPFRYTEYRKERIYHEVLVDEKAIATAVNDTFESHCKGRDINSIIKLLALSRPAIVPEIGSPEATVDLQQIILSELSQIRNELRSVRQDIVVPANIIARKDITPDLGIIRNELMILEALIMKKDEKSMNLAEMVIKECKEKLSCLSHGDISPINQQRCCEMIDRLESLAFEFERRKTLAKEKKG